MKKKVIILSVILILGVLIIILTGCTNNNSKDTDETNNIIKKDINNSVVNESLNSSEVQEKNNLELWESAIKKFDFEKVIDVYNISDLNKILNDNLNKNDLENKYKKYFEGIQNMSNDYKYNDFGEYILIKDISELNNYKISDEHLTEEVIKNYKLYVFDLSTERNGTNRNVKAFVLLNNNDEIIYDSFIQFMGRTGN